MDDLEKKLFHDLGSGIEIPDKVRTVIEGSLNNIKEKKKYSFIRIALTTCASLILVVGVVYAGNQIYEKIWKEPEKVTGTENQTIEDITKASSISEEEARKKAIQLLEKFGYKDETIKSIEIEKNMQNYDSIWKVETQNNVFIDFDANEGKYFAISYNENNILSKDILKENISKEEAEALARKLCEEYGYNLNKYNKVYVIPHEEENLSNFGNENKDVKAYQWDVVFSRTYESGSNSFENIRISFVSGSNKVYYFMYEDEYVEDNQVIITEQEARQIVLDTEEKIKSDYNIQNIHINLDIAQMNGDAFLRMENYELYSKQYYGNIGKDFSHEEYTKYRTDNPIRKVWMVTIECNEVSKEGKPIDKYYTYHVDATTGEITGGSPIYYLLKLQNK